MSISQSLYNFPQQDFAMDIPNTYIHVMHLIFCGRIFKHTIFKIVYGKKEHQDKTHADFLGIACHIHGFFTIPSQIFITYILHSIVSGMRLISSKEISNNTIFLFQRV